MTDPANDLGLNAHATLALLEAARRAAPESRIVFSSTRQVYGRAETLPVSEAAEPRPVDVNGVNKLAAERYHSLYHAVYGLRTVSLRLVNTFGPRQLIRHARQGFLGWFVRLAVEGKDIPVFGEGPQLRDINYVDDVVEALLLAGASDSADGHVFNLGGTAPVSLEQVASILIGVSGSGTYHHEPFPAAAGPIDIGSFYSDYSKFTALTGWKPRIPLEEGFARTLAFYREHWEDYG
jgi:nucleoside-diphosphate-sugar epimerase